MTFAMHWFLHFISFGYFSSSLTEASEKEFSLPFEIPTRRAVMLHKITQPYVEATGPIPKVLSMILHRRRFTAGLLIFTLLASLAGIGDLLFQGWLYAFGHETSEYLATIATATTAVLIYSVVCICLEQNFRTWEVEKVNPNTLLHDDSIPNFVKHRIRSTTGTVKSHGGKIHHFKLWKTVDDPILRVKFTVDNKTRSVDIAVFNYNDNLHLCEKN